MCQSFSKRMPGSWRQWLCREAHPGPKAGNSLWPWLQDSGSTKTPSKVVLSRQVCLHNRKLQGVSETLQVLGPLATCPFSGMGQSDDYVILQRHREQSHNVQGQRLGSICSDQHLFVGSGNIYNWSSGRNMEGNLPRPPNGSSALPGRK